MPSSRRARQLWQLPDSFPKVVDALRAEGVLRVEGDDIRLTREGLLEVDRLIHAFFLPQHRGERYV